MLQDTFVLSCKLHTLLFEPLTFLSNNFYFNVMYVVS